MMLLLTWFYLTAFAVLLGAEVNAELERQTTRDTTDGPARPLGRRGATMADTVGRGDTTGPKGDGRSAVDQPPSSGPRV